jgi:hypothetical protein
LGRQLIFQNGRSILEQIEALKEKIEKLTAGAAFERHTAKDLSVVALMPEFTGRPWDIGQNMINTQLSLN